MARRYRLFVRTSSRTSLAYLSLLIAVLAACHDRGGTGASGALDAGPGGWSGVCVDVDRDGYGFQCENGDDCDDTDPTLNTECGCDVPRGGCACDDGTPPVACIESKTLTDDGSLLCSTGERYCRDGAWTDCVGVRSFTLPGPSATLGKLQQALIDQDAAPVICDVCQPDCYGVADSLDTIESDPDLKNENGGLTLTPSTTGTTVSPDVLDPTPSCTPGVIIPSFGQYDNDCDGIPDNYDNNVGMPGKTPPFATSHTAITMDLGNGDTGSNTFELTFVLKTVDVYFLLDTTASMDGELNQLIKDLTTGNFLDDPSTTTNEANDVVCASPLGSTTTDPTLKTKGIAGNIACKVPNAAFGAGWFREIPFDNRDSYNQSHAYDWFLPYEHRQDIHTDVNKTLSALKLFYTAGNVSWPEDDIYALHAVATGAQIYTGWDRPGTEAKTCADSSNYFGYPCFRKSALPVVVLITDASMMNGPDVDIYKNSALSSCVTTTSPFTITTTTCTTDATCRTTFGNNNYFCKYQLGTGGSLSGRCAVPKAISSTCAPDGIPDNVNDDYYRQPVNYATVQTNTMSKGTDANYRKVSGNEDFLSAYDVTADLGGAIDNVFVTYVGDTRGMRADITSANLGASCSQWPTSGNAAATSETTPGYPDAVFKFRVDDPNKTLTISTAGSHHAPTLAIISEGNQGVSNTPPTQLTAPATSDSTPWSFSAGNISGNFDYNVSVDLSSGFTGQWRRAAFGTCMDGAPNATDTGPDAIFAFTPDADMDDVTFSVGSQQIVATNDSAANASPWMNLGSQLGQLTTYYGTTSSTSTTNKWTAANLGTASCRGNSTAANREHLLKFTLATAANLELRLAAPSTYDTVLSVFGPTSTTPTAGSSLPAPLTCNRTASSDDVITRSFAAGTYYVMVHSYSSTNAVGTYTLTIEEQTDEAIVLYDTAPSVPTEFTIAGPKGTNSNDQFYDYNVGDVDGQALILNAGDTSATNIHADYLPTSFQQADGTCQDVTGLSNDAVVEFNVDTTRKVRIETFDGSGASEDQAAGFDHALAIVERPAQLTVTPTGVTNNDDTAAARVVTAASIPAVVGGFSQFTGATYSNANTVPMTSSISPLVMYDPANADSATCSTVSNGIQDVVYRFDVDAGNEGYYDFDTVGSQSTTYLSLHTGSPESLVTVSPRVTNRATPATNNATGSSSPSGAQSGVFLGSVDGKTLSYSDTTTSSTSTKWMDAQFAGCRLNPANNQAREQVISFSVAGASRLVTITATQTSPFDGSVALFSTAPVAGIAQPTTSGAGYKACTRISGNPSANPGGLTSVGNGTITGTLSSGTYYLVVYGYQSTNNTGSWAVSIADMTTRQARTVSTNDTLADGAATIAGQNLGNVRASIVTFTGETTLGTANKWTAAQAGTGSGATNACRASASDNDVHEQVVKFTVGTAASGAVNRQLKLELTRLAGAFDPVMSVYSGSANLPVSGSLSSRILGCQRAYVANSPASKVFTGSPALTGTGNATTGGVLTGTFPPGTYYVVINGAAAALNSVGQYKLVVSDLTDDTVAPIAASGTNFSDAILNSGGTGGSSGSTSGDTPYYDIGTLGGAGFAYTGAISSSTSDKWTGPQLGGSATYNCQSVGDSVRPRAEHVYKVGVPANSSVKVAISSSFTSSSGVVAYYNATSITGVPQIGTNLGAPAACATNTGTGFVTLSNSSSATRYYWVLIYPRSAPSSGPSYTGSYTVTMTMTTASYASTSAATGGNFSDAALNSSISGDAPFLDFGTISTTNTLSYAGTTGLSTPTKWTHAQLGAASGRTATSGAANNAVPEHLFRFTTSSSANLTINLTGLGGQQVALSVFQSAGIPQTHANLSPTSVQTSNNASASASVSGTYDGTYYVLVHGARNGQYGSYALSIGPTTVASSSVLQSGGNFSNSALNASITTTTSSFSNLNNAGNGVYGDFGTVSASQGYTYTGALSTSSRKRYSHTNVAASQSFGSYAASQGCRTGDTDHDDNSYEQAFRFYLASPLDVTVTLDTAPGSDALEAAVSVFGPINWTASTPAAPSSASSSAASVFNGGTALGVSACNTANDATVTVSTAQTGSSTWAAGYYLVLVHSRRDDDHPTGAYTLSVAPSTFTAPVADFGALSSTPKHFSGTLSSSTSSKWTGAQMAVTGHTSGCRSATTATAYEHAFKFSLPTAAAVKATLSTNFSGVVSIFGPVSSWTNVPKSNTTLTTYGSTVQVCANVNATTGGISGQPRYPQGDYLAIVHGYNASSAGSYTLTLESDGNLQSGGNFSNAALDATAATPTMTARTFSTTTLNGNGAGAFGNFGTVTATQGYTYNGTLSAATSKRWAHGAVVTSNDPSWGCRYPSASRSDANYEHVFKVTLDTSAIFRISEPLSSDIWGPVSVFGPISATFGTNTPVSGATPALAFNNGSSIATATCALPTSGTSWVASTAVTTTTPGDYLVMVHSYDNTSAYATGNYGLTITPLAAAPYADFGSLGGVPKYFAGTLSASTARKWSSSNVGYSSLPNGCRTNSSSTSYEHAFKFNLPTASTVTAALSTSTGSSPFNGILSIFGPISNWTSAVPAVSTTLTNYGGSVASCINVNQTSASSIASLAPGDYLVLVQGQGTGTAGNYALTLSASTSPYAADSQNSLLNATTTAVVADFGDVTSTGWHYQGSTAAGTAKWSDLEIGGTTASCRSASSSTARDVVKEHAFKFNVTRSTNLRITLSNPSWSGSGSKDWDSVVSLFGASTADPSVGVAISNPAQCKQTSAGDSVITSTLSEGTYYVVVHGDTDSDAGAYKLSVQPDTSTATPTATATNSLNNGLNGGSRVPNVADFGTLNATAYYYSGNTSSAVSKWVGSDLATATANSGSSAATGCRQLAGTVTGEHVFKFTLGSSHYVKLSVSPSGFDPVLSVFGPLSSVPTVDNPVAGATHNTCFHNASNGGTASNGTATIENTFAAGTYYVMVHGFASASDVPGAQEGGSYTLTVDPNQAATTTLVSIGQDASAETQTPGSAMVVDLGTVNNFVSSYQGTTSTSTSNKWTATQIASGVSACRASASQDSGREHLFKFTVGGSTALPLKLALGGALDGVLSVFSGSQPVASSAVSGIVACSRRATPANDATTTGFTASAGQVSGSFAPGDYYAIVHGYGANNVGDYSLTITDESTTYSATTVATNSVMSGSSGAQSGVDLGTVDGSLITYTGDTTGALNKWTQAQVSAIGATGCRAAGNDAAREHVLRFSVATPRRVAMRVSTTSTTFQPVLTLLGTTAPSVNSTLGAAAACTHTSSTSSADNLTTGALTASNGLITGDLAAGTYYLMVHGYASGAPQGAYTLSVFDADAEVLGLADNGRRLQSDGDTSTISFNQWRGADLPSDLNAVAFGGRYSGVDATSERIYAFTVADTTKTLTVGLTATFDSVISVWSALPTAVSAGAAQPTGLLQTNRNTGTYARAITRAFAPGTYYVMVQGYRANNAATPASGTYTISVGDDDWQSSLLACNSRSTASKLTAMYLTAGSYYLVLKSGAGTGLLDLNYRYTLNIRRTFAQPFIACDHEGYGEGSRRAFLETTLEGGKTYAIVVRGMTPSDRGTYGVVVRDMSAGSTPLGCANAAGYTSAPNNPNSFTADLEAGREYYVVVRSNSDQNVGQTNVRISHAATSFCGFNNVTFDSVGTSAGVSPYVPAKIVTKLPAGDYYAVVKGNQNLLQSSVKIPTGSTAGVPDDRGRGRYQITFGDASLATNNQQFTPPVWGNETSGTYAELKARGIRVITVNSVEQHGSADLYMREQSKTISIATGAVDADGNALRKNIGNDGSGMGYAIVDAVADFAQAVQMDMSVRLALTPHDPGAIWPYNRRFKFKVRAVLPPAGTSNGCAAAIDTDADGVVDTHPACGPGATPRFEIQVTNPARGNPGDPALCVGGSNPGAECPGGDGDCPGGYCTPGYPKDVPYNCPPPTTGCESVACRCMNPYDPGKGYLMRLQLIGKDRLSVSANPQIIDEIPLYVIPEQIFPDPDVVYPSEATYEQTVNSAGCMTGETPRWRSLHWRDKLPPGTSITWSMCGGDTDAQLADCEDADFVTVATVTPGNSCASSADCSNAFCNDPEVDGSGICEKAVGRGCLTASDCGVNAACVANQCQYYGNPYTQGIDLSKVWAQFDYKKRVRVRATLKSNADHSLAPTIYDYKVNYTCGQNE